MPDALDSSTLAKATLDSLPALRKVDQVWARSPDLEQCGKDAPGTMRRLIGCRYASSLCARQISRGYAQPSAGQPAGAL